MNCRSQAHVSSKGLPLSPAPEHKQNGRPRRADERSDWSKEQAWTIPNARQYPRPKCAHFGTPVALNMVKYMTDPASWRAGSSAAGRERSGRTLLLNRNAVGGPLHSYRLKNTPPLMPPVLAVDGSRPKADERRVAKSATVSEDTAAIRRPTVPSVQPRSVALPQNKPRQWDGNPLSSFGSAREQSQFSYPFESHGSQHLSFNRG